MIPVNRITLLTVLVVFTCLTLKAQPPNLVIVYPDQFRGQAMGFVGEEPVITPNIDAFAKESVYFPEFVSSRPVCSPTRAMLMTGKYPHHNGVLENVRTSVMRYNVELHPSERTWSDVLHDNGYFLGYIGKWHLNMPVPPFVETHNNTDPEHAWNAWTPPERRHGFEYWHAYGAYNDHIKPMYWDADDKKFEYKFYNEWSPTHEANRAIDFIRNKDGKVRDPGKPFALFISINPPHTGNAGLDADDERYHGKGGGYHLVPREYKDIYKDLPDEELFSRPNIPAKGTKWGDYYRRHIRNYYANITGVDVEFGRILEALEEQGLEENTIVVFTSDHGNCVGIHNEKTKTTWFEESMRVPLLIRFPGKLQPRKEDLLLSYPDIYPTLLDLMGFRDKIPPVVDGKSYVPYLLSGKGEKPGSQLYLNVKAKSPDFGDRGIRTDRYTLVIREEKKGKRMTYLYDREKDPYQLSNIADENPALKAELTAELKKWLVETDDPWIRHLK